MRVVPLLQYQQARKVFGLIYGGFGCGKTIFSTSSKTLKTLVLDVDKGMTSALAAHKNSHAHLIDVVRVDSGKELLGILTDVSSDLAKNPTKWGLVTLDTITELSRILITEYAGGSSESTEQAQKQHWGKLLLALESTTRVLKNLPCHSLILAHENIQTRVDGQRIYHPNFRGQFNWEYGKHFDWIARQLVVTQTVLVEGTPTVVTSRWLNSELDEYTSDVKDRFITLDKYENPDLGLDPILSKMMSSLIATQGGQ